MIILILGAAATAAVGLGWYGHKASLRIAAWGHGLDEQDLIFKQMSEAEGEEIWSEEKRRFEDAPVGKTSGKSHYPAAAALK